MTIIREYITKPPDLCTGASDDDAAGQSAQIDLYQCCRRSRNLSSREFEFRKNTKYAAGTPLRHSRLPVGAQIEEVQDESYNDRRCGGRADAGGRRKCVRTSYRGRRSLRRTGI